jgi:mRNA interferase RelE/StbE
VPSGRYQLTTARSAEKGLARLDRPVAVRVARAIRDLRGAPRPAGAKSLTNWHGALRLQIGDYRVIYTVDDAARVVHVERIGHRSTIYR